MDQGSRGIQTKGVPQPGGANLIQEEYVRTENGEMREGGESRQSNVTKRLSSVGFQNT